MTACVHIGRAEWTNATRVIAGVTEGLVYDVFDVDNFLLRCFRMTFLYVAK